MKNLNRLESFCILYYSYAIYSFLPYSQLFSFFYLDESTENFHNRTETSKVHSSNQAMYEKKNRENGKFKKRKMLKKRKIFRKSRKETSNVEDQWNNKQVISIREICIALIWFWSGFVVVKTRFVCFYKNLCVVPWRYSSFFVLRNFPSSSFLSCLHH